MLQFWKILVFVTGSTLIGGTALAATLSVHPRPASFVISGAVDLIHSPEQYHGVTIRVNHSIPVQDPHYYVVHGHWTGERWAYPYAVHASGSAVLTAPVAVNGASHTELIVAGIPEATIWQWLQIPFGHGMSTTSQIPLHRKP